MHLKAAVCDGVAFLSDRNWSKYDDTIIRDDAPADVHAVHAAALYSAGYSRRVQLDKLSALAAESRIITPNGGGVVVATEAIGYPSPVYSSLRSIAKSGAHPKLLISNYGYKELKHRHAAQLLEDAGVRVRVTHSCEKFAIAGRKQAWIGSANATSTHWNADEIEWGLRTRDPRIVRALESRFNRMWNTARRL
jgi:hypothetical protein